MKTEKEADAELRREQVRVETTVKCCMFDVIILVYVLSCAIRPTQ